MMYSDRCKQTFLHPPWALTSSAALYRDSGRVHGYDRREIFSLETEEESGHEVILLLDIGTHDEVY